MRIFVVAIRWKRKTARLWLSVALCLCLASAASAGMADAEKDLPALDRLEIFQPGEPSILYTVRDEPFATLAQEFRIAVPLSQVPKLVRQAVLDIEDTQFYEHGAVSLKGMARATLRNLTSGKVKEGGSTITQQLAKSLFLSSERTWSRKVKEIQIAAEIEQRYTKDKILEMYLNAIYFGSGAYGIEAASRTYFGKSISQVNLPEAALLAGLIRAPSVYSPLSDLKRAKDRRDVVLGRMKELAHISANQAAAAIRTPVTLNPLFKGRGTAAYFVDFARRELEPRYSRAVLAKGGLKIQTTLDLDAQRVAIEAVRKGAQGIEKALAGRRKGKGPDPAGLEAALVAIEPGTGEIRAMVGGVDYAKSQFNRAVQARRQPGSAFKPFVYATAFERGFTPATIMDDFPVSYSIPQNGRYVEWRPENVDRQFRGPVTLRQALEESINVPTIRLLEAVGVDPVAQLAHRMGIKSGLRPELGLALGVSEVNLLELTSAYTVFGNQGLRMPPTAIRRVIGPGGEVFQATAAVGERVLSAEVAFIVTSLLQGAVERGTAKGGRVSGWSVAAKTGTSQNAVDMWFVGFTPRLATGLWIGYDQPRAVGSHETAGRLAAPVWADFMRRMLRGVPPETTPIPEDVLPVRVNYRTGRPTDQSDPGGVTEYFIRGAMPERDLPFPGAQTLMPDKAPAWATTPAPPTRPPTVVSPQLRRASPPPPPAAPRVLAPPSARSPTPVTPRPQVVGRPASVGTSLPPSPPARPRPALPLAPLPNGASNH